MATLSSTKKEESAQLDLGIQVSVVSQFLIRLRKNLRDIRYSLLSVLFSKPLFWINFGFILFTIYAFLPAMNKELPPNMEFFVFPGMFNAQLYGGALVNSEGLRALVFSLFGINIFFSLIAYGVLSMHRSRISDVILVIQFLINIVIFKAISQNLWLWSI